MIEYDLSSRQAISRLMEHYNDIDVFVEDSSYVGVYQKLINKALAGRGSVASVTALGPKSVVLEKAYNDNTKEGRPRLYIVDGDFDFVARKRQKSAKYLYRLNVYSIENLVFEEVSTKYLSEISLPNLSDAEAHRIANYNEIVSSLEDLKELFISHAIANRLGVTDHSLRIESASISELRSGRAISPSRKKARSKAIGIIRLIKARKGRNRYRIARSVVLDNIAKKSITTQSYVPGKEFQLKYLVGKIGDSGGICLNQRAIVAAMATHCTFSRDPRLVRRIRKTLYSKQYNKRG